MGHRHRPRPLVYRNAQRSPAGHRPRICRLRQARLPESVAAAGTGHRHPAGARAGGQSDAGSQAVSALLRAANEQCSACELMLYRDYESMSAAGFYSEQPVLPVIDSESADLWWDAMAARCRRLC